MLKSYPDDQCRAVKDKCKQAERVVSVNDHALSISVVNCMTNRTAVELVRRLLEKDGDGDSGKGIEAYGVRGMKSSRWRKTFKSQAAMDAWVSKHDAEVHGTREAGPDKANGR